MDVTVDNILLIGSILLFISILAGKTSYKFGVPTLVLFLFIGILAGSEGLGGINFTDAKAAQFIGVVALNFILFSGGFDTKLEEIKPVLKHGVSLSIAGVFLTALFMGLFIYWITDFTIYEGLLLGSIVSSTDAAAVFSILRSKNLALKKKLRPTLELESGSNDPMAYFLTVTFVGLIVNDIESPWEAIPLFLKQILLGAVMGLGLGRISKIIINKIKLDYDGLYPVLIVALVFITYSSTDAINGNGFLAVYLMAITLGNVQLIHKASLKKFFDGIAWLMQIVLFLTLGLLVFPSQITPIIGLGLLFSAFLMFVARPLSVFITLAPFKLNRRTKWYISWVGLRGAVPIVFATFPLLAGIEKAPAIFNIVFFISLSSIIVQGTTLPIVAKWLGVSLPAGVKPGAIHEIELAEGVQSEMMEVELPTGNPSAGKQVVDLRFPRNTMITMIIRENKYIVPRGSTQLMEHDRLVILAERADQFPELIDLLGLSRRPEE